ncbi:Gfo/Idh/MocA family protein [Paraglaciecola arctica]|uniref:Oxidoreductase-like n=1 Tax=Paraglaciecola arctica BSs20135 TaxID=493475 RepID=K6XCP7_9ALTE|nr:Gfo/Idh/MocA family oxidoreductase [Paraglaciecola arctica]GAC18399.1 oxidoreductase-like [Paraglaciecola arctica BSs20135]
MQSFNWGVIGPGNIANTFAKAIASSTKGKILAVASRSKERAADFAKTYHIEKTYSDYQQMLADPEIDIIYIATPHSFHYQQAKMCLEAGKHVLVEKPCTVNAEQMQILAELAQSKNLLLQEALWSRFLPCLSQLRQLLNEGIIGDIQYIQSEIGFAFQDRDKSRMVKAELAGGSLLDLGIYSITVSQFFLQEHPDTVSAMGQLTDQQDDGHVLANMHYPSGRFAQFTCSMLAQSSNTMRIVGAEGYIDLPACFWDTDKAEIFRDNKLVQSINIPHPVNGFEYQIEESMGCIEQKLLCSEVMSHRDSIGVLRVMDDIRKQIGVQFPQQIETL